AAALRPVCRPPGPPPAAPRFPSRPRIPAVPRPRTGWPARGRAAGSAGIRTPCRPALRGPSGLPRRYRSLASSRSWIHLVVKPRVPIVHGYGRSATRPRDVDVVGQRAAMAPVDRDPNTPVGPALETDYTTLENDCVGMNRQAHLLSVAVRLGL